MIKRVVDAGDAHFAFILGLSVGLLLAASASCFCTGDVLAGLGALFCSGFCLVSHVANQRISAFPIHEKDEA